MKKMHIEKYCNHARQTMCPQLKMSQMLWDKSSYWFRTCFLINKNIETWSRLKLSDLLKLLLLKSNVRFSQFDTKKMRSYCYEFQIQNNLLVSFVLRCEKWMWRHFFHLFYSQRWFHSNWILRPYYAIFYNNK